MVAEVGKALDREYSEDVLFHLGGYYDHSEELPGKAVGKDNQLKKIMMRNK